MSALAGYHMFHPSRYLPLVDVRAHPKMHDERPMNGQWRVCCLLRHTQALLRPASCHRPDSMSGEYEHGQKKSWGNSGICLGLLWDAVKAKNAERSIA